MKDYCLTDFQKKVYRVILDIPLGQTRSYQWVAKKIGTPKATRAVGSALKKNPFAPMVPCHRVVKRDGAVGGYSNGIKKKMKLLQQEREIKEKIL